MRLSQNGKRSGDLIPSSGHTDAVPPVDRQHPPHRVIVVELGKPVVLPCGMGLRGLRAAKRAKGQRAGDRGKSERRAVTVRIGDNVLHPKGAPTSAWCGRARAYAESFR